MAQQPTAEQIATLPLRAIVAYALRAAQRVLDRHSVSYRDSCQACLFVISEFIQSPSVERDFASRSALAAAAIAEAEAVDQQRMLNVGLSIRAAAGCCITAVMAICNGEFESAFHNAALDAAKAARQLDEPEFNELAAKDFELLRKSLGQRESDEVGAPFDPLNDGPLGPIWRVHGG